MDAYALYLTLILINGNVIEVGRIRYFDTQEQCEMALNSADYRLYLDMRYGGWNIKDRNSSCIGVDSI